MLSNADGPISLVIDEGNMLAKIPEQDLRILLQLFRSLKHASKESKMQRKGLASLILIGTEELSNLVKEGDKHFSPFSHVRFQKADIYLNSVCTLPFQTCMQICVCKATFGIGLGILLIVLLAICEEGQH